MGSPAVIDIEALTAPVPGDAPAGVPLGNAIRAVLDEARKEADPLDPTTASRRADWVVVIRQSTDALTNSSKDLLAAARLLEALAKKHDFTGLRDGFRLMTKLVTDGWDRLHPIPEDGEGFDIRVGQFSWLNDSTRGARFPHAIAGIPLFRAKGDAFSFLDWVQPDRRAEMDAAIPSADLDKLKTAYEDLTEARTALVELGQTLDGKLGEDAPDLTSSGSTTNMMSALDKCTDLMRSVMRSRGLSPDGDEESSEESTSDGETEEGAPMVTGGAARSREALYRQLSQIATALERLDPHSPVPHLLHRAVKLGALPFPDLMRAIIRESGTLDELDRLLGLQRSQGE